MARRWTGGDFSPGATTRTAKTLLGFLGLEGFVWLKGFFR